MTAYYNEHDPAAAAWLRELIRRNLIAPGDVDERSIVDVRPTELVGYTQCHFFAGIGTWSYALRAAGWPDDEPVWTGSPPCQPFSAAGRRQGYDDKRHLAPAWLDLIRQRRPPVVFAEQVAGAASNAKHPWLDDLQDALEAEGYATGAVVLPACGVGAPHIRQRLWFVAERVAESDEQQRDGRRLAGTRGRNESADGGPTDRLGHPGEPRLEGQRSGHHAAQGQRQGTVRPVAEAGESGWLADAQHPERRSQHEHRQDGRDGPDTGRQEAHGESGACGEVCRLADSESERQRTDKSGRNSEHGKQLEGAEQGRDCGNNGAAHKQPTTCPTHGF